MSGETKRFLAHAYLVFAGWITLGQGFGTIVGYAVASSLIQSVNFQGEGVAALVIMLLGLLTGSMIGLVIAQNSYWPPKTLVWCFERPRVTHTVAALVAALPTAVLGHIAGQVCVGIPLSAAGCRTLGFCTGLFMWWLLLRDAVIREKIEKKITTVA